MSTAYDPQLEMLRILARLVRTLQRGGLSVGQYERCRRSVMGEHAPPFSPNSQRGLSPFGKREKRDHGAV